MRFKDFLLNENKAYFTQKVSDVLSALQDLNDSVDSMGARHLVSNAETIVNQMRRIIHTHWPQSEEPNLKMLQKCAVAIKKAIEEKDDLAPVLKACQQNIEQMSNSGSPTNKIATDDQDSNSEEDSDAPADDLDSDEEDSEEGDDLDFSDEEEDSEEGDDLDFSDEEGSDAPAEGDLDFSAEDEEEDQ